MKTAPLKMLTVLFGNCDRYVTLRAMMRETVVMKMASTSKIYLAASTTAQQRQQFSGYELSWQHLHRVNSDIRGHNVALKFGGIIFSCCNCKG